jgi:hypothetical protein
MGRQQNNTARNRPAQPVPASSAPAPQAATPARGKTLWTSADDKPKASPPQKAAPIVAPPFELPPIVLEPIHPAPTNQEEPARYFKVNWSVRGLKCGHRKEGDVVTITEAYQEDAAVIDRLLKNGTLTYVEPE